jgi:hypothetical protein
MEVEAFYGGQQDGIRVRIPASGDAEAWIARRKIPDEIWAKLECGTKLLAEVTLAATSADSFNVVGVHLADDFFWTLAKVHGERDADRFNVVVPAWDPHVYVPAPIEKVPEDLRPKLRPEYELEALANLLETDPNRFLLLHFRGLRQVEKAQPPPQGMPVYRTMLDVLAVSEEAGQIHAEVDVTGFEGEGPVRIPGSIVPWFLRPRLRPGTLLFAKVNLGETDPGQLQFFDFELAPQPTQDHVAAGSSLFLDP